MPTHRERLVFRKKAAIAKKQVPSRMDYVAEVGRRKYLLYQKFRGQGLTPDDAARAASSEISARLQAFSYGSKKKK